MTEENKKSKDKEALKKIKGICWTWTLNLNDEQKNLFNINDFKEYIKKKKSIRYISFQQEIAPTTGQYHLQGYIQYRNTTNKLAVINIFNYNDKINNLEPWVEYSYKSVESNIKYTTSEFNEDGTRKRIEGTEPIIIGKPDYQGNRKDLDYFWELIKTRKITKSDVYKDNKYLLLYTKYRKTCDELFVKYGGIYRTQKPIVHVFYGESSSGKTTIACEEAMKLVNNDETLIYIKDCAKWWDNYIDQEIVIIDDFNYDDNSMSHYELISNMRILKIPNQIKGGYINHNIKHIFITSNKHPKDWFPSLCKDQLIALDKRIDDLRHFQREIIEEKEEYIPFSKCREVITKIDTDNKIREVVLKGNIDKTFKTTLMEKQLKEEEEKPYYKQNQSLIQELKNKIKLNKIKTDENIETNSDNENYINDLPTRLVKKPINKK